MTLTLYINNKKIVNGFLKKFNKVRSNRLKEGDLQYFVYTSMKTSNSSYENFTKNNLK